MQIQDTAEVSDNKSSLWAVVALKSPETAKSRLRRLLSDAERRDLYFIMARKVIGALQATPGIDKVMVVTTGVEVEHFATQLGAEVIRQTRDKGTAAAFAHAVETLAARAPGDRPGSLLMIPGDLPLISVEAMTLLVNQANGRHGISIVPDRKRVGTNALLCSPPNAIPPCFGSASFEKHLAVAAAAGVTVQVHESESLSLDIDVADDLALLGAHLIGLPDSVDATLRGLLARLRNGAITTTVESLKPVLTK